MSVAETVAHCLSHFFAEGMAPRDLARLLRAFMAGLESGSSTSRPVDVVVSGPGDTEGARDTGVVVRQLFARATQRILVAGFAVHQGKTLFRVLADRLDADPSLDATLCLDISRGPGDTSLARDIVRRFAVRFRDKEWPGQRLPDICFDPRSLERAGRSASSMHAKCVVIDGREALVTSANFTEAAQQRNIELGLLVDSELVARRIEDYFRKLIKSRTLIRMPV